LRHAGTGILLLAAATTGVAAQAQAQPKFEVSTVKPNSANDHRVMLRGSPGGRFEATGVSLKLLITEAYDVRDFQISGGPPWIATERWDIVAKAEGITDRIPPDQLKPMLAGLIEDRFQIKSHRETKELPIYVLVIGKTGSKLQANAGEPGPGMYMGRGHFKGTKIPISMLAQQLSQQVGRTVVDKTGLKGDFDFTLDWTPEIGQGGSLFGPPPGPSGPEGPPPGDPNGPSIFTAVQEQLGLKLESDKGPVDILVLDKVERPTEN
jgi:uncharacterized protein (TIGR03435 family)